MKKFLTTIAIFILLTVSAATAHADLESVLSDLNFRARADIHGFSVRLSSQFGVSLVNVQSIIRTVEYPADAYVCLQLGRLSGQAPERVLKTYTRNKRKGWGAVARELGIKPGSDAFHALKRGEFEGADAWDGDHGKRKQKGKYKSKDKHKGKSH